MEHTGDDVGPTTKQEARDPQISLVSRAGQQIPPDRVRRGLIVELRHDRQYGPYVVKNPGGEKSSTCVLMPLDNPTGRLVGVPKEDLLYTDMGKPAVRSYLALNKHAREQQAFHQRDPRSTMRNYGKDEWSGSTVPEWDS